MCKYEFDSTSFTRLGNQHQPQLAVCHPYTFSNLTLLYERSTIIHYSKSTQAVSCLINRLSRMDLSINSCVHHVYLYQTSLYASVSSLHRHVDCRDHLLLMFPLSYQQIINKENATETYYMNGIAFQLLQTCSHHSNTTARFVSYMWKWTSQARILSPNKPIGFVISFHFPIKKRSRPINSCLLLLTFGLHANLHTEIWWMPTARSVTFCTPLSNVK